VNETPVGPTVLVADEDVGFIWWLADLLAEFGYRSIPALGSRQALSLVKRSGRPVDLALINPRLRGAARLILILRHFRASKIVLIQDPEIPLLPIAGVSATIERPSGPEPVSRMEWRQKIHRLLLEVGSRAAS
jgi:hypothetical protein